MNTFRNISKELYEYFNKHNVFSVLLPFDKILILGGAALMALFTLFPALDDSFIGNIASSLAYWDVSWA